MPIARRPVAPGCRASNVPENLEFQSWRTSSSPDLSGDESFSGSPRRRQPPEGVEQAPEDQDMGRD
eukprot:4558038-Alexandrium_andersonii.AAC.1